MSGKLDQSLDEIMGDNKKSRGGPRRPGRNPQGHRRRAAVKARAAIAAPTGGVQKNSRPTAKSTATTLTASATGESKVLVSNLPDDVTETQIKDYFSKTIGHTKRVFLTYGPTGRSRGVATIIFSEPNAAAKAANQLDGVKVDNRAMKVEVVLGAKEAPKPVAPKSLADRVAKPKSAANEKPKPAAGKKAGGAAPNGAGKAKAAKAGNAGRRRTKKKTAEELDAEMVDYFGVGEGGAAVAPAATNGDAMVDEVM